jgi:hypothetical protein
MRIIYIIKEARMGEASPCGDGFTCLLYLGFHGTVSLRVDESNPQPESGKEMKEKEGGALKESLGPPIHITALPLGAIGRGDGGGGGVTMVVAPTALGYSVMGSENSQFAQYIDAFINMAERSNISGSHTCLTGREIARFFNSFDKEMYSFFDSRFNKQFNELQGRFLARAPQDPKELEKVDFTQKFVTFASDEMLKRDFNTRMQESRTSAGLYWREHHSCISEKLYCPGTHANQCSLYFPGGDDKLRGRLASLLLVNRFERQEPSKKQKRAEGAVAAVAVAVDAADEALCSDVSIASSSDKKLVLTITFDNDPRDGGFVKNKLWKGITLNTFFEQIKRYLNFIFHGVDGFDGFDGLMSRTCIIDTACANFSVSVPGQHVSIISVDNGVGASAGVAGVAGVAEASPVVSMVLDVHNDPDFEMGWWQRKINLSSGNPVGSGAAYTHSSHPLSIPRELMSYVPSCLVCDNTIKSVEPIFDETTRQLSVVYTYRNGRRETFVHKPQSLGAVGAAVPTDSMGAVWDEDSLRSDDEGMDGGRSLGRRKLLRNMRRGRSLRNKRKTKRDRKIRGLGVRPTRRKRTRRTLRRR